MKQIKGLLSWLAVAAWMVVIFLFSAQTGDSSGNTSGQLVRWVISIFYRGFADLPVVEQTEILEVIHLLIRKGAHFTEYAILAMLVANALRHLEPDLRLGSFAEKPHVYLPRQAFFPTYQVNGAIYIWRTENFSLDATIYTDNALGYEMSRNYSFDIDDLDDFVLAEAIINYLPEFENYFEK